MQAVVQRGIRPTLPSKTELPSALWPLRKLIMRCVDREVPKRPRMSNIVERLARVVAVLADSNREPLQHDSIE